MPTTTENTAIACECLDCSCIVLLETPKHLADLRDEECLNCGAEGNWEAVVDG